MDFAIAKTDGDFVVLKTHTTGRDDSTPLNYVSTERLAELLRIEAAAQLAGVACPAPTPASSADGIKSE